MLHRATLRICRIHRFITVSFLSFLSFLLLLFICVKNYIYIFVFFCVCEKLEQQRELEEAVASYRNFRLVENTGIKDHYGF